MGILNINLVMDSKFNLLSKEYDDGIFSVNEKNGFLPKNHPLRELPAEFTKLQDLVTNMRVWVDYSKQVSGYLAEEGLLEAKVAELPNYKEEIENFMDNPRVLQALFRSYAFLTSAYLLAPSYHTSKRGGGFGKAHTRLPAQIAQPFVKVAQRLGCPPFMQYHYSSNLGNYYLIDPEGSFDWTNLKPICTFLGAPEEEGFLMVHNDIDSHSSSIVESIKGALKGLEQKDATAVIESVSYTHLTLPTIYSV
eukprot:TRINITY_DN7638_c0_g2_i2.p1 TRINITY_DN7638_c0_g2~~TRINITY_DN7638_c0_g2_i2.p1  ORF type:complete len:250 (-),score=46.78 TRINITY_DN7638_c0_g2_i2:35-784(-)